MLHSAAKTLFTPQKIPPPPPHLTCEQRNYTRLLREAPAVLRAKRRTTLRDEEIIPKSESDIPGCCAPRTQAEDAKCKAPNGTTPSAARSMSKKGPVESGQGTSCLEDL